MKEKGNYIFGKSMGNLMKKISPRTQMEASMMSMAFILLGLVFMAVYVPFFTEFGFWFKLGIIVNTLAGIVFLLSYLVTTFQQYRNYLLVMGVIEND